MLLSFSKILFGSSYAAPLAIMSVIVGMMLLDTSLGKTSIFFGQSAPSWKIPLFVFITATLVVGQFLLLEFTRRKSKDIRTKGEMRLNLIHKNVLTVQIILTSILVFVTSEVVALMLYNMDLLIISTSLSYGLAITMMMLLAKRFFSWFRQSRHIIILIYGLSFMLLAANAAFTLILVDLVLPERPSVIVPHIGGTIMFLPGSLNASLNFAQTITLILGFILTWCATAMMLHNYSHRLGMLKYWIIISIPLLYFLSQFLSLFLNLFAPLVTLDPVYFSIFLTLVFTYAKPAGAILFGFTFWIIARRISSNTTVADYMVISSYGIVLLFISNQASLLPSGPFPPFGLNTTLFMGLSAYMVLVGIYSSAVSVSQDIQLRKLIRSYTSTEARLLDSIGYAQMERELEKKVLLLTRQTQKNMKDEYRIESSLTEDDVKQYLGEVIKEIKRDPE
jgi:hypothetical protein